MYLKLFMSTLVMLALFVLLKGAAELPPEQPKMAKACGLLAGLMVLSIFPQALWWIWSLL